MDENNVPEKKLYTIPEAASLVDGLTEYCVRKMCRDGTLKTFRSGRKYLIDKEDLFKVLNGENQQ